MDKLIGHIGVDSGQVMIVDPCYVIDDKDKYEHICEVTLSDEQGGPVLPNVPNNAMLAVAHSTRDGDGVFPVYAECDKDGRILSLRVEFAQKETECYMCGSSTDTGEDYCESCQEDKDNEDEED